MGGSSCTGPQLGYKLEGHLQLPRLGRSERKETHQTSCLNTLLFFIVMLQLRMAFMQSGTHTIYFNVIPLTPHCTTHDKIISCLVHGAQGKMKIQLFVHFESGLIVD